MVELIQVPVPVDRVLDVYRLLAGPPAEAEVLTRPQVETERETTDVRDADLVGPYAFKRAIWPPDSIRQATVESNVRQLAFLLYLVGHPGEFVGIDAIAETLKIPTHGMRGPLSGLSRRAKHRHNQERAFYDQRWTGKQYEYRLRDREVGIVNNALEKLNPN